MQSHLFLGFLLGVLAFISLSQQAPELFYYEYVYLNEDCSGDYIGFTATPYNDSYPVNCSQIPSSGVCSKNQNPNFPFDGSVLTQCSTAFVPAQPGYIDVTLYKDAQCSEGLAEVQVVQKFADICYSPFIGVYGYVSCGKTNTSAVLHVLCDNHCKVCAKRFKFDEPNVCQEIEGFGYASATGCVKE
eukprot:CAMPEP_0201482216 /NCGR_PEP_ID=MMETSP0151_2-20130828/6491_1 /ASSEMBLY_ACC=CAM_ASM_000257 /TAXON_ID=200890 /ORGANISM="Paramoeba atlantica, Strain 621/1 / CCAP 1560/9" /LENGTH=186 /DNA_ID=CAMNT_0047864807 /DNA_START=290 /DNA_END=850 /DNA_ORIENTATION=+